MKRKKLLKKEMSVLHFILMTTGKLLIGIGIGLVVATNFWFAQPYWYFIILIGAIILLPTLYSLFMVEEKEEKILEKKLKKK
ncbi:MAG: hypothetical protein ACQER9_04775 [Nanobdellota archaeon]